MGFFVFIFKLFLFYMFFRFVLRLLLGPVLGPRRGGRSFFGYTSRSGPFGGGGKNNFGDRPSGPPPKKKRPFADEEIIEGEFEELDPPTD